MYLFYSIFFLPFQFRAILSDAVAAYLLAYAAHLLIQQPMRNLAQVLRESSRPPQADHREEVMRRREFSDLKESLAQAPETSVEAFSGATTTPNSTVNASAPPTSNLSLSPYTILARFYSVIFTTEL